MMYLLVASLVACIVILYGEAMSTHPHGYFERHPWVAVWVIVACLVAGGWVDAQ